MTAQTIHQRAALRSITERRKQADRSLAHHAAKVANLETLRSMHVTERTSRYWIVPVIGLVLTAVVLVLAYRWGTLPHGLTEALKGVAK